MSSVSLPHQWPRGPRNGLHDAAIRGCTCHLVTLLSDGSIDIDQGDDRGDTPLMLASFGGHSRVVRILLDKGANLSALTDDGADALHASAEGGHPDVCKILLNAGADLETATNRTGSTPLYLAAQNGHSEVMRVLIEAGANPDVRTLDGATPLFIAAQGGHKDAIKLLLRATANPMLTATDHERGMSNVPLDVAADNGHSEVVRELVHQVRIEGCGGASRGRDALCIASQHQHLDILIMLTDAGVADNGRALFKAAAHDRELSAKFLLQQRKGDEAAYVNYRNDHGLRPLLLAMGMAGSPSPRFVRLLVDAGADTTLAVRITDTEGGVLFFSKTALATASRMLREKRIADKDATEEQLHRLEGVRRLLLRVDAVHAVSFLWPAAIPSIVAAAAEGTSRKVVTSTPLRIMLPILKRRARTPRVLLAALFRLVLMLDA